MNLRRMVVFGAVVAGLGWLAGCGDSATDPTPTPPPPPPPDPPRATTVTVSPATAELTALGATVQLAAEVRDQNGQVMAGAAVSWASSSVGVATVDASGTVTAVGDGTATITAAAGSASGNATVTVAQTAGSVTVSPAEAEIALGDTLRLTAEALDANGHSVENAEFSWASSDEATATVDASGLATGVAAGEAEITATSSGVTGRAALTVLAPVPAEISVTPDTVAFMALGETAQLSAEVLDQFGRPMEAATVSWTSADTTVATVDADGLVTAAGSGATTVTATAGDVSDDAVASVMQTVGSVTVSPAEAEIAPGDTLRLTAEALDANGHAVENAEFSWASSDETVATVDASGLVTAIAEGVATMTASSGTASATGEVTVVDADRAVLVALYEASNGPDWLENGGWLSDRLIGEWHGVTADSDGRVTAVRLSASNLVGSIPPELGRLTRLETLDFERNELAGPIPPELSGLSRLTVLDLGLNDLTGPIPAELGALSDLVYLRLRSNDLTGAIPPELGGLSSLIQLGLTSNDLTGAIPPDLGGLSSLVALELGLNDLTGSIPPELGGLSNLVVLSLSSNELTGPLPPELGGLPSLTNAWLDRNELTGPLPPELGGLTRLARLSLYDNELTGAIPPELGRASSLTRLHLYDNDLTGPIPPELGRHLPE